MAENQDGQEKTEPASAKRLHEAELRGQVSKSMDITTAAVLLIGGMSVFLLGKYLIADFRVLMRNMLYSSSRLELNMITTQGLYQDVGIFLAKSLLPIMGTIFLIVLIAEISQVGFKFATKKFTEGLMFKQIFNPLRGIKKIFFSGRSMFELLKSVIKVIILGGVVYWVLAGKMEAAVGLIERPFSDIAVFMVDVSMELVLKVGLVYLLIAIGDFFYQKHRYREDLKMTKQEVKEETKQTEGDPKVKSRLRSIMRQRIRKLMLRNVANADVVITNPTHFAVALKYSQKEMSAPRVVAKGVDFLALHIRELAEKNDVPVVEQPPLARTLYFSVDIDQEIPENLFKAVAQVLAYVYRLKKNRA